jgi:outer membrane protein TolC
VAAHLDFPLASGSGARVESAQAQADAAAAQLVDARRRIALEVASAVRDLRADGVATQAADRARDEAARALSAVELGYREGASTSLDIADARRTYQQATVDALVAEYQRALAFAVLQVIVP